MAHLGRYRLVDRLGSGAFATVWLAHDDELDVEVAVKVLADNWVDNIEIRERFLSEARLLRRISDPRVVRVHDIGTAPDARGVGGAGTPYFVMDYVAGGTLAPLLTAPPPPYDALRLGAQAAYAVQALHDHEVVHRDVKPSNFLLGVDDRGGRRVLVTDLGMAKLLAEASGMTVTAGTPAYMAPEQIQGSNGFDARADVYALAAVSHALVTGRPPFPTVSLQDVLLRDSEAVPEPLAARYGVPSCVDALLASALRKDPTERPGSAIEFADRLLACLMGSVVPPAARRRWPVSTPTAAPGPALAAPDHAPVPAPVPAPVAARYATEPAREERAGWSNAVVALWSVAAFLVAAAVAWAVVALR